MKFALSASKNIADFQEEIMTPFDKLLEFLFKSWRVDVLILGKLGILLFLFLYLLFALMIVRQIHLMSKTVKGTIEKILMLAAKGLVILSIAIIVLALFVL